MAPGHQPGCGRAVEDLPRRGLRWALEAVVVGHLSVARITAGLGVAWDSTNEAVLAEFHRALIVDPRRFDAVEVIGVMNKNEHVWRHTMKGDKYVTVIIDLTPDPQQDRTCSSVGYGEARSKQMFSTWLTARPQEWRDTAIQVVAMDASPDAENGVLVDDDRRVLPRSHEMAKVPDLLGM